MYVCVMGRDRRGEREREREKRKEKKREREWELWWERGKASFPTGGLVILAPETDGWDQPRFTLMLQQKDLAHLHTHTRTHHMFLILHSTET